MRKFITLSAVAALATAAFASEADLQKQIDKLNKKLTAVKIQSAADNLKFDVDFRTSVDMINYETASGEEYSNDALLANRLWLGMGYQLNDNMVFKGQLSYNKAYGANPPSATSALGMPQRGYGFDSFDWVINENLTDNTIKLREAYWLYSTSNLFDSDMSFTASFGRRPSTNGFLANLREDDNAKSPLGHVINLEFDGASFKFGLDQIIPSPGMYFKLCFGRGLTNASARFNMDGGLASMGDYTERDSDLDTVDMAGFIFVPYNDGQYSVETTYYRGFNVPGFDMAPSVSPDFATGGFSVNGGMVSSVNPVWNADGTFGGVAAGGFGSALTMQTMGDQDGAAISFKADGIGDGISDFLDDTIFFASYGWSKTNPNNERDVVDLGAFDGFVGANAQQIAMGLAQYGIDVSQDLDGDGTAGTQGDFLQGMSMAANGTANENSGMLGSDESETGSSYWVGVQFPALITEDGRIGIEYNHGSEYWRPFTYGEDTMIGSKLATRGDAMEVYWTQPLMGKAFTAQLRYTYIDYEYTGSQGFFGAEGTPMKIDDALAMGMDAVDKATDLRFYLRYRY